MKVQINPKLCQGHGRCYHLAPGLFGDDDEGYGEVLGDGVVTPEAERDARLAVFNCPEQAVDSSRRGEMAVDDRFTQDSQESPDDELQGTRSEIITGPVGDGAQPTSPTLEPEWSADPYPIQDDLRQRCPIAHTGRFGGAWLLEARRTRDSGGAESRRARRRSSRRSSWRRGTSACRRRRTPPALRRPARIGRVRRHEHRARNGVAPTSDRRGTPRRAGGHGGAARAGLPRPRARAPRIRALAERIVASERERHSQ